MKKQIIILLLFLLAVSLALFNPFTDLNHRNFSGSVSPYRTMFRGLLTDRSEVSVRAHLQMLGSGQKTLQLRSQTASADGDKRKALCNTFLASAELSLDALINAETDDEFETAAEDFANLAVDWVVWDCSRHV